LPLTIIIYIIFDQCDPALVQLNARPLDSAPAPPLGPLRAPLGPLRPCLDVDIHFVWQLFATLAAKQRPGWNRMEWSSGAQWMWMWMRNGVHWSRVERPHCATNLFVAGHVTRAGSRGVCVMLFWAKAARRYRPPKTDRNDKLFQVCTPFVTMKLIAIQFPIFSWLFYFFFSVRKFATHFRWTTNFGQVLCGQNEGVAKSPQARDN